MAKSDKPNLQKASATERNTVNTQYGNFLNTANTNLATATATTNEQNSFVNKGYEDIVNQGGLDPTVAANLRAINKTHSTVYDPSNPGSSGSGSGSGDSGSGSGGGGGNVGGTSAAPADPFATSRAAFQSFLDGGGVDMGALKEALGGYRTIADSGGFSPDQTSAITKNAANLSAIGETGGFDPKAVDQINSNIGNLSEIGKSGGFSPEAVGLIKGDIAGLRTIGQTGGVDADAINKARGYGVFENMANTGGYTPDEISNIRQRSLSPISAQYGTDLQNIERSNALQGAASPNYAASIARLGRNRALATGDTVRNTELDIQDSVRKNKLEGAKAGSAAEIPLQTLITGNKLAGLQSSAKGEGDLANAIAQNRTTASTSASTQLQNLQTAITNAKLTGNTNAATTLTNLANSVAGNKLTALGGITNTQQGAEGLAQTGKIAGANGMYGIESTQASLAQQASAQAATSEAANAQIDAYNRAQQAQDEQFWGGLSSGNEQYIGSAGLEGKLSALGGLNTARGTASGDVGQNYSAILNGMAGRNAGVMNTLQLDQSVAGGSRLASIGKAVAKGAGVTGAILAAGVTGGASLGFIPGILGAGTGGGNQPVNVAYRPQTGTPASGTPIQPGTQDNF